MSGKWDIVRRKGLLPRRSKNKEEKQKMLKSKLIEHTIGKYTTRKRAQETIAEDDKK
jgi:hypothetical protein